ncbi:hypothetical protein Cgig2_024154 [Carnegiea gigantea]|uniref:Uncharacterized protein n=1 Tax=Carnegiea gigantea TaxID=171969 RepID=A0A9Q1KAA4_9CARY|nr:hypothetical protein Cgig2_024154 [Carnegiea gigantea]
MGRAPCCDKTKVKKGPWSPEEDDKLKSYIEKYGTGGNWIALPQKIGLNRCGKSCRLRWLNYLRPNIKHGDFTEEEDNIILNLYISIGSRWSIIAAQLPGRTDNDVKNYWNTRLKKKLLGKPKQQQGDPNGSVLSSSALERIQLHMQLQCPQQAQQLQNPLSLLNNPSVWPHKLHPFIQDRPIQHNNLQTINIPSQLEDLDQSSSLNGSTSSEISNGVDNNNNDNNMINNFGDNGYVGMERVSSFQAELDQLLGGNDNNEVNEIERISGWWSDDSKSTNWDASTN